MEGALEGCCTISQGRAIRLEATMRHIFGASCHFDKKGYHTISKLSGILYAIPVYSLLQL